MNVKNLVRADRQTFQAELRKLMTSCLSPRQRRRLAILIGALRASPEDAERFGRRAVELDTETVSRLVTRALEIDSCRPRDAPLRPAAGSALTAEERSRYAAVRESFCSRLRGGDPRLAPPVAATATRGGPVTCDLETWDLQTWDSPTRAFQGDGTVGARGAAREWRAFGDTPARIGPYRILRCVGCGGLGAVYLAEARGAAARVALKTVRPGADSAWVRRRFEAERRALLRVEHEAVVKVLGAGESAGGEPYLVLEHVPGVALTKYCDSRRHGLCERLELFRQVCDGVQHVHDSGVVHRDLKPSNVLVAEGGGRAMAKIVDFGLATLRGDPDSAAAEDDKIVGTPAYMSPEQAGGRGCRVDRRTDVYSLGVMLYELLVGLHPFSSREVARGGVNALLRLVREGRPRPPSDRFAAAGSDSEVMAARRGMAVAALRRELRRELDAIVMKAMHRDPRRRYGSATALAAAIDAYRGRGNLRCRVR